MSQSPRPNSRSQVIILSLLHDGLNPTEAARRFGVSREWIYQLLARYKTDGLEGLEPRSRKPLTNPRVLTQEQREEIIRLRQHLLTQGLDAGAASIAWHLRQSDQRSPALSTIWRILRAEGLVTPEPKKRPKAYITRFEAAQPNETWQSDFTHWRLKDGTDVEIINWLDDHSRLLLKCTAHQAITGKIVIDTFNQCRSQYGTPFSTLTDNGNVYTARFFKGKNGFEYLLSELDVIQKNGSPAHPQTQGKIERFHQTLKKWLSQQQTAADLKELQQQLDEFRTVYNTQRPHRALEMKTPQHCYEATIKATPKTAKDKEHYRVRYDSVDQFGKLTLRRAGKMHHLGIGIEHQHKKVILIVDHFKVSVVEKKTGEILSKHEIDPSRNYWTNSLLDDTTKRSRKPK
ncbi:integrase core domain protein [mine drainage metagenome]|uniref:Integrase core domain protein n=1 Tax=mine drainage metagenome TaxID=410659 RepID=A0A1J5Q4N8_9ZZZZ